MQKVNFFAYISISFFDYNSYLSLSLCRQHKFSQIFIIVVNRYRQKNLVSTEDEKIPLLSLLTSWEFFQFNLEKFFMLLCRLRYVLVFALFENI